MMLLVIVVKVAGLAAVVVIVEVAVDVKHKKAVQARLFFSRKFVDCGSRKFI
jgi:hypothetical protein